MKILIFTVSSAGSGHIKTAEAIKEHFEKEYSDKSEVRIIDTLKYINPIMDKIIIGSYLTTIKSLPKLYEKMYYSSDNGTFSDISELFNKVLSYIISDVIEDFNPDIIVSTHPFSSEICSILKYKDKVNVPCVTIITDYTIHSLWLYDYMDAYIIANEDLVDMLVDKGISKKIIYPLGIPIKDEFKTIYNKNDLKLEFGLSTDKKTVLLMGGGLGIGNIKDIYKELLFSNLDIEIIVCTGNNKKLKNQLENMNNSDKKSIILGYTNEVYKLMSVADILITKPGGITMTEAMGKEIPPIFISPIPGQEEENTLYFINNGIGSLIKKETDITHTLNQIINNSYRMESIKTLEKLKSKPNATSDICKLLINLIKK